MFSQPGREAYGGTNIPNNSAPATTPSPSLVALFVNVRPQYRPSLRRPSGSGKPSGLLQASREQLDTTTERTKSTRRSEVPSASGEQATSDPATTTTATTPPSLLTRRRRPTTASNYLAKIANRQRPAAATAVMSSTEETTTTTSRPDGSPSRGSRPNLTSNGRRKYGPANRTGYTGSSPTAGSESSTTASIPSASSETSPEVSTRPVNSLFKRRNNGSPLTRTTTPTPLESIPSSSAAPVSSKFFKKNKYRTGALSTGPGAERSEQPVPPASQSLEAGPGVDQNIEPSIRQNSKLYNAKNRYQQIGEPEVDGAEPIEQELLDALTTLSRAPLPVVSTTTVRNNGYESVVDKEWVRQQQKQPAQQQYAAEVNGRATTHRYNVTHDYPNAVGYGSVPAQATSTHRLPPPVQRPRIATHSEYYYQQTTPGLIYTSPIATATISPRQDTTVLSQQFPRNHQPAHYERQSASSGRRKQKDDVTGRTYRPSPLDYDYYDDGDTRKVGKSSSQVKVIMHGPGIIECLDQGNFPHPLSCKKFISCAKMEIGGVIGWEYTCPKGLSYDPVGGICNWSAGLGCNE
uniref:Chitin-binding type-2 domain-containing protein n=1 Tax=Anopheles melas TaxID=34690 RepID=A0A182TN76_9DIPT